MARIFGSNLLDYAFIETIEGESPHEWCHAIANILNNLWDNTPPQWWTPFTAGPVVRWAGRKFRAFHCPAGSVSTWLMVEGQKRPLPRAILMLAQRGGNDPKEWPIIASTIENGESRDDDGAGVVDQLKSFLANSSK